MTEETPTFQFALVSEDEKWDRIHSIFNGGYVQKPTVGRIVHYTHAALVGDNGEGFPEIDLVTHAALIMSVGEGYNAFLHIHPARTRRKVFGSVDEYEHNFVEPPLTRTHFDVGTPYSETPKPGHWSWPPR